MVAKGLSAAAALAPERLSVDQLACFLVFGQRIWVFLQTKRLFISTLVNTLSDLFDQTVVLRPFGQQNE